MTAQTDARRRILAVLEYVQANMANPDVPLSLEDLAHRSGFSLNHFHRVFKGMVGESVREHIRRLHLERAAMALTSADTPVTTLAYDAGYDSLEGFSRAFKAHFGRSPSAWREAGPGQPLPESPSQVYYATHGGITFRPVAGPAGGQGMAVEIIQRPPCTIASLYRQGPYMEAGRAFGQLGEWAYLAGALTPESRWMGMYYDDPSVTPAAELRYEAAMTLPQLLENPDARPILPASEVVIKELPGGRFARYVHVGPYDALEATYDALMGQWMPSAAVTMKAGPSVEVYVNDPTVTPPAELRTEIYIPLES